MDHYTDRPGKGEQMNQTETTRHADEGAEAWRVPPRRYLREHPPAHEG